MQHHSLFPWRSVRHSTALIVLGLLLGALSVPLACAFGALDIALPDVARALASLIVEQAASLRPQLFSGDEPVEHADSARLIILELRLPRVLLAYAVGLGLAMAGTVFQGVLRNPLADPFTLGISGGAAFGAALAISLGVTSALAGYALPASAFAGGCIALTAVLLLGGIGGGLRHETLILAGVVVSAFLAALIALVKALDESSVTGIVFWIMGSFQGRGWSDLVLVLPGLCLGCAVSLLLSRELDLLSLGDDAASAMGLSTTRIRVILLVAAGAVTGSCVAVSGIIGFVGLIIPHLMRMLLGAGHRVILTVAGLGGGLLLLWSDVAARTLLPGGVELPVSVITALLGGPFFCLLLKRTMSGSSIPASWDMEKHPAHSTGSNAVRKHYEHACYRDCRPAVSTAHASAAVRCEDIDVRYRQGGTVLAGLSLSIGAGEFTALLGPNGSGKSTLLKCIAGLIVPERGHVLIHGAPIPDMGARQRARQVALLAQSPENVPGMTVQDMVVMGRYAHTAFLGAYSPTDGEIALEALRETGVRHLWRRTGSTLSGGELQRVLLARTLAQATPLVLLDEAAAGLDPAYQVAVFDALARRNAGHGLTIFSAMHDLNLAALYCRRLIFLKKGCIVADGSPNEVFTTEVLEQVYDALVMVTPHPVTGSPQAMLLPGHP